MINCCFFFCLCFIIQITILHSLNVNCQYNLTNNVTYDISKMVNSTLNVVYVNGTALPNLPVYYLFNLCGDIVETPNVTSCYNNSFRSLLTGLENETGFCSNISNNTNGACTSTLSTIEAPVGAYQVINSSYCYRLHDGITLPTYSLINTANPVLGFFITYTQGDYCPSAGHNRGFSMIFLCDQQYEFVKELNVVEETVCSYTYTVRSKYACPTQCLYDDKICSNSGACVYDAEFATARCLCTNGANGTWCEQGISDNDNNNRNLSKQDDDDDDHWPRWLGILLACLAGLFLLCCCLALLALWKKNKNDKDHDSHHHHQYERPQHTQLHSNEVEPERVAIVTRNHNV